MGEDGVWQTRWKVVLVSGADGLDVKLNQLATAGWDIFKIHFEGPHKIVIVARITELLEGN